MAAMKVSAVFEAIDRMTAPIRKIIGSTDGLQKSFGKVKDRVAATKAVFDKYAASADKARTHSKALGEVMRGLSALFAGFSAGAILKGFLDTGLEFEKFGSMLETTLGSKQKAKAALDWIQDFATTTPYQLGEVTDAFVKLNAYGIDAADGTLKSLGDASAGMGKTLDQAVEAFADAQQFEFERLKEFGVQVQQQGDKVRFAYQKDGQQFTIVAKKTSANVSKALRSIFDARFAGAMDKQSKTLAGILSNIGDWWTRFQKSVDEGGYFDAIKSRMAGLLDNLNAMSKDGRAQAWAKKIGEALGRLFDSLYQLAASIDWPALIDGITGFVSGGMKFVEWAGGLKNIVDIGIAAWIIGFVMSATKLIPIIEELAAVFGASEAAIAAMGGPITLVIVAVAALAAGAFLLWRNWDKVKKWFIGFWAWMKVHFPIIPAMVQPFIDVAVMIHDHWSEITKVVGDAYNAVAGFITGALDLWNRIPKPLRDFLAGVFVPGAGLLQAFGALNEAAGRNASAKDVALGNAWGTQYGLPAAPMPLAATGGQMRASSVSGTVNLQLNTPPGLKVTGMTASDNLNIDTVRRYPAGLWN